MVALLVILFILSLVAIDSLLLSRQQGELAAQHALAPMRVPAPPADVFLDSGHTWLRIESDGTLRLGLDDFLTEAIGDVERVELPEPGTTVRRGSPLLTVVAGTRRLVVPSPAAGTVGRVNGAVAGRPHAVAAEPYGHGWLLSLQPEDLGPALAPLRVGPAAREFLTQQVEMLSDLLTPARAASIPVMADGAVPARGSATRLDDESWNAFQGSILPAGSRS